MGEGVAEEEDWVKGEKPEFQREKKIWVLGSTRIRLGMLCNPSK